MITNSKIGYSGRLGNQMFQYAALLSISKTLGYDAVIPSENLQLKSDGCLDLGTQKWIPYRLNLYDYFPHLSIPLRNNINTTFVYKQKHPGFDQEVFNIQDDTNLEGYFQSEKYFSQYKDIIRNEFQFKPELISECKKIFDENMVGMPKYTIPSQNITYSLAVSIHLRRTDFLSNPINYVLDTDYFQNAIEILYGKFDAFTKFFVFSDDIPYCKEMFGDSQDFYYSQGTEISDLCLMSMCDHFITSNSTLSWWGAWIGNNSKKIVITPSKWFNDGFNLNNDDLIPEKWIKI